MSDGRRKVMVVGAGTKPRVREAVERALPVLGADAEIVAIDLDESVDLESVQADLVVVFGGDGAILKAARRLGENLLPVCGVKLGRLGFLATLTDDDLDASLRAVVNGDCTLTSALMLDCRVDRDGATIHRSRAVNDAVVSRGAVSRIISADLMIDGEKITTYNADGVIVSTPLGSTAHCLAAGGPIVEAGAEAMILIPICPHTLSNRPVVISADRQVALEIGEGPEGIALTMDGQVFQELRSGDTVSIERASRRFDLVRAAGHNYFKTLRDKLGWSGHLRS